MKNDKIILDEKFDEKGNLTYYKIEIDQTAKDLIAKNGVDDNYGARPLRRAIQNLIEDKIAEAILDGKIKPNKPAKVTAQDDKIQIS
jgi:ATP-dependent Clp protease ATP-binding subunit ClpC